MKKVVLTHTDLRLYWPPRLKALKKFLGGKKNDLQVIEIAGKGSPYAFSKESQKGLWWTVLFPNQKMENISPQQAGRLLWDALEKHNPDIILAGAIAYPSGAVAVRWAKKRHKKVVIFDNARLPDVPRSRLVNWIKSRIYANVDAMLLPAPSHAPDYLFWGINEDRMFFGLNVVDNSFFTKQAVIARKNAGAIRQKYNLPKHFFLGVGRQVEIKNWDTLIHAFGRTISEREKDWGLVLVGDGPKAPFLKALAAEQNCRVVFLPFQTQEDLCQLYALAEAFVLPSSYGETWGLVVNEAMACGLPVIVSRECGCALTLVKDGHNGWTIDPKDPLQLSQVLGKVVSLSEETRREMGEKSFVIISNWGLEKFCDGVWQAIQLCLQTPEKNYDVPIVDQIILTMWNGRYRPV